MFCLDFINNATNTWQNRFLDIYYKQIQTKNNKYKQNGRRVYE